MYWVNIGSGSGLLPDGTKSLTEPMLTYHHIQTPWPPITEISFEIGSLKFYSDLPGGAMI